MENRLGSNPVPQELPCLLLGFYSFQRPGVVGNFILGFVSPADLGTVLIFHLASPLGLDLDEWLAVAGIGRMSRQKARYPWSPQQSLDEALDCSGVLFMK